MEIDLYVYIFTCTMCIINIYIYVYLLYILMCAAKSHFATIFSKITTVDMYPVWNHCAGQS